MCRGPLITIRMIPYTFATGIASTSARGRAGRGLHTVEEGGQSRSGIKAGGSTKKPLHGNPREPAGSKKIFYRPPRTRRAPSPNAFSQSRGKFSSRCFFFATGSKSVDMYFE